MDSVIVFQSTGFDSAFAKQREGRDVRSGRNALSRHLRQSSEVSGLYAQRP